VTHSEQNYRFTQDPPPGGLFCRLVGVDGLVSQFLDQKQVQRLFAESQLRRR
jgi:hypothetical protein